MSLTMAKPCLEGQWIAQPVSAPEPISEVLRWYMAYTQPRHEKAVEKYLRMRELETYLPLHREMRRWNGRRAAVEVPLFAGYVFVHLRPCERLKALEHSSVVSFVSFGGCPA